jgi:uncharacterized membrane protein
MSTSTSSIPGVASMGAPLAASAAAVHGKRITSIDALRGLVMCIMMMDHVRETLYLHHQVTDPMIVADTPAQVFFSRLAAHFCAPVFVFLTGLGAWLYANPPGAPPRSARDFLLKRGALLIFLEITVMSFLWVGEVPKVIWLQVLWAIGFSMIVLAFASSLPRKLLLVAGLVIVCGHNALAWIDLPREHPLYGLWTLFLHRGWLFESTMPQIRVTYPALPWVGVILLGWCAGPIFARGFDSARRRSVLVVLGLACWATLLLLRGFNIYGENAPWTHQATAIQTVMDFLNYTKYPPSLDFLLMTLGGGFFVLAAMDQADNVFSRFMSVFGGAPMFYYLVHLAVLISSYKILLAIFGPNQVSPTGVARFGVGPDQFWLVWVVTVGMWFLLYYPTKWFGAFKRRSSIGWVKYF